MKLSNNLNLVYLVLMIFGTLTLTAQKPSGDRTEMKIGRVFGKVLDNTGKHPLAYATVVIVRTEANGEEKMIEGNLTEENGEFNFKGLPLGSLTVKINYVGNKDIIKKVRLTPPNNTEIDLGNLVMEIDAQVLSEVEIKADKVAAMISLEKRVFNVDKNITAAGGTAEDILKNVPSITVDMDGGAKLRDKNTTIYVDGKPSLMSLNQIPADQIESVEVISNPSAKYEAATTGGIVNIILKKNRKAGYNGSLSLGVGNQDRYNGSANLNTNEGKWNLSSFYSYNTSNVPNTGFLNRTNFNGQRQITDFFNQYSNIDSKNQFHTGRVNFDYQLNNRNTLTISGSINKGEFNNATTQDYEFLTSESKRKEYGTRLQKSNFDFQRNNVETQWRKNYTKKNKSLTLMANYAWGNGSNTGDWVTSAFNGESTVLPDFPEYVDINGYNDNKQGVVQLDYVNPLSDSSRIEMGIRSFVSSRDQVYFFNQLDNTTNEYILQKQFSQNTIIDENIHAAYVTYSGKMKYNILYQAGLRFEYSDMNGKSLLEGFGDFGYTYPKGNATDILRSLFPSLYITKQIDTNTEIGLNFSRKIQRPNHRMLMPGVMSADRQNITIGNPNLQPEFINLAELNFNKKFGQNNWLSTFYFSNETNTLKPLILPSPTDPTILVTTFVNGEHEITYGLDNTLRLAFGKKLEVMLNGNFFRFNVAVDTFTNSGFTGNAKATVNYKLPANFSIQINGGYDGNRPIPQGERQGIAFADFALKKTLFKNGTSVTFNVSDVFNSRRDITIYDQPTYIQESMRRRETRFFRLTVQVPFGKADGSLFKRSGKRGERQDQNDEEY